MEELFESKVLNDLYEIRTDGIEAIYIRKYGKPEDIESGEKADEKLRQFIREKAENEEKRREMVLALETFEDSVREEKNIWTKVFYKKGFVDGVGFEQEVREIKEAT